MPRGIPKHRELGLGPSENTQRLLDAMRELEERIAVERRKDRARVLLLSFCQKHGLAAADLKTAARALGERKVGDAPVLSPNLKLALGKKLKEARIAKGLKATELGKMIGAKGTAAISQWERGMLPGLPKYRSGLIRHLGLPKTFFDDAPPTSLRGTTRKSKANGAAHA